jgi:pimeloyl-ACP methyl ester carboxylesterase
MRWRNVLFGGGAAAIAGAAAYNVLAKRDVPELENLIGGDERWFGWRGWQVAYTVRGRGPAVLLVHGIHAAASSYEWRANVHELARHHTVYAIDLLGFGRSSRPNTVYSARLYQALLDDFVEQVVRTPCALVASSLSAAYAIALAARNPGQYPALIVIAPTGLVRLADPATSGGDITRFAFGTPVLGTAAFNGLVTRASLRRYLEKVYASDACVTEELVDVYYWAAHQPGAKFAPSAFIGGKLNVDVRRPLRSLRQPTLLVWGEQADMTPLDEAHNFLAIKPDLELSILSPAGDLPHDERSEEFNEVVREFFGRVWSTAAVA